MGILKVVMNEINVSEELVKLFKDIDKEIVEMMEEAKILRSQALGEGEKIKIVQDAKKMALLDKKRWYLDMKRDRLLRVLQMIHELGGERLSIEVKEREQKLEQILKMLEEAKRK